LLNAPSRREPEAGKAYFLKLTGRHCAHYQESLMKIPVTLKGVYLIITTLNMPIFITQCRIGIISSRQYEGPPKIGYRGLAAESSIPHILREAKDDKEKRDK